MKTWKKIIMIVLWLIALPILILIANNRYFSFINNRFELIIWAIIIVLFFVVFTLTIIFGFRNRESYKNLNIEYEENPARKLFELAEKYHLDLEINDALNIYEEIKKKYPNSIYEKEAQIEINRIKGNRFKSNKEDKNDKALEILRIAYAEGKITKKEFDEKRKDLEE